MKGTAKIAYWDTAAGHRPPALLGEIKGTPTIRLFKPKAKKNRFNRKKNVLTYNFERKKKDMKRFVDANLANYLEKIKDAKSYDIFIEKADRHDLPKALVFSKSKTTTPLLKYASTEYRRRMLIGVVKLSKSTKELSAKFDVSNSETSLLVIKEDGTVVKYAKKGFSFHKVVNFLGDHALKKAVAGKKPKKKKKVSETDAAEGNSARDEM